MNDISPIETDYNGYRFRSRLEARWAVFFDALNIPYQYEAEGFQFDGLRYLPDFWLPNHRCWVEIKGKKPSGTEIRLAARLAQTKRENTILLSGSPSVPSYDFGSDYAKAEYAAAIFIGDLSSARDVLGDFAQWISIDRLTNLHTFLQEKHLEAPSEQPMPRGYDGSYDDAMHLIDLDRLYYRRRYGKEHPHWEYGIGLGLPFNDMPSTLLWSENDKGAVVLEMQTTTDFVNWQVDHPRIADALLKARQARFEYGETPY